jgi:hypothetical protein
MTIFKIHPAIGIARLGDSQTKFYLSPEQPGQLPIACDDEGRALMAGDKEQPVTAFKDGNQILRQAARFRVFGYQNENDAKGAEIKVGEIFNFEHESAATGRQIVTGIVFDIEWTVHLANKKASWYQFEETEGMHGYAEQHKLRNPHIVEPDARRQLIIDPGPQTVSYQPKDDRHKHFAKGKNPGYPQNFPPENIRPKPITTLGELNVNRQNDFIRLIVLGGHGNSGSSKEPVITQYANNDAWFDDVSDGPVTARVKYAYLPENIKDPTNKYLKRVITKDGGAAKTIKIDRKRINVNLGAEDVDIPAWVVVGYPRYAPELVDMITMDEAMFDVFVRHFALDAQIYGVPPFDKASNSPSTAAEWNLWPANAQWNPNYYPKFYQEIWPILKRPELFGWVFDFDHFTGADPHNVGTGGNLDQEALSKPPQQGQDPHKQQRQFIYSILRKPGQENQFLSDVISQYNPTYRPRAMPDLFGNNPLSNTAPEKFLRLTDTQLFVLKQWADGKFVNECQEWGADDPNCLDPFSQPPQTGIELDRGVLGNVLGGAFCPGGELGWIMLNPAIYSEPYRIKSTQYQAGALSLPKRIASQDGSPAADLTAGLEPGDLTKYMGLPWQSDFTQCAEQSIDVTYENWVDISLDTTGDPAQQKIVDNVPWWPAHRPLVVYWQAQQGTSPKQVYWGTGIPENNTGGLRMVTAWQDLGFIKKIEKGQFKGQYVMQERNNQALGPPEAPGSLRLGNAKRSEKNG